MTGFPTNKAHHGLILPQPWRDRETDRDLKDIKLEVHLDEMTLILNTGGKGENKKLSLRTLQLLGKIGNNRIRKKMNVFSLY